MFSAEESNELLKVIEEAYSVLSNGALRRNYDENIISNQCLGFYIHEYSLGKRRP